MKSVHTKNPLRLNQQDTARLPYKYLILLAIVYIFPGLIWRGLWQQEATSFGAMLTMAQGSIIDWLLPNVAGAYVYDNGPLPYWIGAIFIQIFSQNILSPFNAAQIAIACQDGLALYLLWQAVYRLGIRDEMQPQRLAFGGEPAANDYGHMLADSAVLLFIATYGIAASTHDTSNGATQLMVSMMWLYGASSALAQPNSARWFWGLGLAGLGLSLPFALFVLFVLITLSVMFFTHWRANSMHTAPVVLTLGIGLPLLWFLNMSQHADFYQAWLSLQHLAPISKSDAGFFLRNIFVFTWPLWPLGVVCLWRWRSQWSNPMMLLGILMMAAPSLHILLTGQRYVSSLLMFTPSLLLLAPFGLATLNRGRANIIDWFSLVTFSLLASFVWVMWEASWMGYPSALHHNIFKLAPNYVPVFKWWPFVFAFLVSAAWALLLRWRIRYEPRALWKSVALSSGGLVMVWVLLATLAMPWLDYTRSYERVGKSLSKNLPTQTTCVQAYQLSLNARAAMLYYAQVPFLGEQEKFSQVRCPYVLTTNQALSLPKEQLKNAHITLFSRKWRAVWSDERLNERTSAIVLLREE